MKEIWAVFNSDVFDRIVLRGWWVFRQECYMNRETGQVSWRDVPFFRKRKQPAKATTQWQCAFCDQTFTKKYDAIYHRCPKDSNAPA